MGHLAIADVASLRATAAYPSPMSAMHVPPDLFKSQHSNSNPEGTSLSHLFSSESRHFHGSALKQSAHQKFTSPKIPLGVGRPSSDFYPWLCVTSQHDLFGQHTRQEDSRREGDGLIAGRPTKQGGIYNLTAALNYGHGAGSPPLLRFVTEHVEIVHNPPYRNWSTCLSSGSTAAIETALRIFCNRGDTLITERYTYTGLLAAANLHGLHVKGVEMDSGGLMPESLARILHDWDEAQGPRPTVLYTIPSGQNPTGTTQSLERKKAIYEIVEQYDLVIIEDDPYFYLPTNSSTDAEVNSADVDTDMHEAKKASSVEAYLSRLPQSYLSIDHSGRVIRLDSVSKILAPGLRAGWITASDEIIDKFISYHDISTVAVSGPSQLMLYNLLDLDWGHARFFSWLNNLSLQYEKRLEIMLSACAKYLPKDICEWVAPQSGMFLWVQVNLPAQTGGSIQCAGDVEDKVFQLALRNGVQVTKGSLFDTSQAPAHKIHFRLTYAAATVEELEVGVKKFADAVGEAFHMRRTR